MTVAGSEDHIDHASRRLTVILTSILRFVSAHWLLLANLTIALYIGLPVLAPVLMWLGAAQAGNLIYRLFAPLCHQLPERSFFLFGPQATYSFQQLQSILGTVPARYIGSATLGYKIAVCERDVAIYGAMLLGGIAFSGLRHVIKPLPVKVFLLLIAPMAIDGFGQLFGAWTSTWLSRVLTGGLFGIACIWFAYPYLEMGMRDVLKESKSILAENKG